MHLIRQTKLAPRHRKSTITSPWSAVWLALFLLSSCAPIAHLKKIKPVFVATPATMTYSESFAHAATLEKKSPREAGALYLEALQQIAAKLDRNPKDAETQRAYNFALDRSFALLYGDGETPWDRPMQVGRFTISYKAGPRDGWHPSTYEFLPTHQVQVSGEYLKHMALREGLGSRLVAIGKTPKNNFEQTMSLNRTYYGVTAVAEFKGNQLRLSFHDPLDKRTVQMGRHTYSLAADYTTPLAALLTRERPEKLGLVRLLDPDKYAKTARISRLRPYDPNRIPLLLVHGLLDTPATWVPMVNAMRDDPLLRDKFQIWVYSYPSGYPYPYSAAILREELDRAKVIFPKHKPIVYIGHSMGGMIGRLMLTDSELKIWNAYFHSPPGEVGLSAREKKLMQDMLIFNSRRDISRAVFICSPHSGAKMAGSWVGKLGRYLVRVPQTMVALTDALTQLVTLSGSGLAYESLPTSIDTLTEGNTFVKTVKQLPLTPRIPYHSIIGDRGKAKAKLNPEAGSDGFVPYTSSHLPGAASERIIPSHHSGHQHPEGIAEVVRILELHLKKSR